MRPSWPLGRRPQVRRRQARARGEPAARRLGRACLKGLTYPFTTRSELGHFSGDSRRPLTFGQRDADAIEAELYSHLIPVKRRIWIQRALLLLVRAAVLVAGAQLVAAVLRFAAVPIPPALGGSASIAIGVLALALIVQQRVSFADAARVLDRRLALGQVIGTGVELTQMGVETRTARLQVRRATDAARRIESSEAIPLGLPLRDLRVFAGLAVATLAFTYLATLNISWPGSPPPDEVASDPSADIVADVPYESTYYEDGMTSGTLDPELFDRSLDDYRTDLENQNLDPEELAQKIAEIQAQLAQRAEALNRQRQALADLADALSDSSASSDAADSIRKGDYQKAASQLTDLGKQSNQLSARARRDLAQKLNDAANKVAPNNQDLAARMRKAAQQLAGNDAQGQQQALSDLADGVNQAGEQMRQLADSNGPFDPSQMDYGENGAPPSDLQAEGENGLSNFAGSGDMNDDMGEGSGQGFSDQDATGQGGSMGAGRRDQGGDEASQSGGAGSGQGRVDQYQKPTQGGSQGNNKVLELRGRPTDSGSSTTDNDPRVPLVASNDGSVAGSVGGARSVIVDPLSVRGEQNFVPWEKRQIVKDYFTGTTR